MTAKHFVLVLHSHIPYVLGHGTWPHGTDWLFEATAETYLPLLNVFSRLADEGVSPQVSISFTPVLAEQLAHPRFPNAFRDYLEMKTKAAEEDRRYFRQTGDRPLEELADFWGEFYSGARRDYFGKYQGDLIGAFRRLQDQGHIEVLTSAATHAYFPLLAEDQSILAQVRQAKLSYRRHFGREAGGFWLPECAYRPGYAWSPPYGSKKPRLRPGVDSLLEPEGIRCFFVDTHLLRGGTARGVYSERFPALARLYQRSRKKTGPLRRRKPFPPYQPYRAFPSGLPFFVRDEVTGRQVWSRDMGYPGDGWYLEFHKKHFPGGLRYWRITSSRAGLADKAVWEPSRVEERLEENASHFITLIEKTLAGHKRGVVVSMYDTELFGHWWYEGPEWIYRVLKGLARSPVRPATAATALQNLSPSAMIALPEGSWGEGGFHDVWLNEHTSWIWEKIYALEADLKGLGPRLENADRRLAKQLMREKFLLESSDWPFLITTWTARDYAENRAALHASRAGRIVDWLKRAGPLTQEEARLLRSWEEEDGLFDEVAGPRGEVWK